MYPFCPHAAAVVSLQRWQAERAPQGCEHRLLNSLPVILMVLSCTRLYLLPTCVLYVCVIMPVLSCELCFRLEPIAPCGALDVLSCRPCSLGMCGAIALTFQLKPSCIVTGNLALGGPAPIGARKANLSQNVEPYMQEIALSEQVSMLSLYMCNGLCRPLAHAVGTALSSAVRCATHSRASQYAA